MTVRTRTRSKPNLDSLLKRAAKRGEARIKNKDGRIFIIRPERMTTSPLDVEGVDLGITSAEIVQLVHEGRRTISTDDPRR
jgi:hypothetical protein